MKHPRFKKKKLGSFFLSSPYKIIPCGSPMIPDGLFHCLPQGDELWRQNVKDYPDRPGRN
ncbi:hypothetical protein HMPREF9374_0454 [Desmospora sp. 8437]|nr:hypothetical protein HMPREF9374_0454 [Desmospora sp. 8437]